MKVESSIESWTVKGLLDADATGIVKIHAAIQLQDAAVRDSVDDERLFTRTVTRP
jgi:hypothetical protein